jgi:hypothetical protein
MIGRDHKITISSIFCLSGLHNQRW